MLKRILIFSVIFLAPLFIVLGQEVQDKTDSFSESANSTVAIEPIVSDATSSQSNSETTVDNATIDSSLPLASNGADQDKSLTDTTDSNDEALPSLSNNINNPQKPDNLEELAKQPIKLTRVNLIDIWLKLSLTGKKQQEIESYFINTPASLINDLKAKLRREVILALNERFYGLATFNDPSMQQTRYKITKNIVDKFGLDQDYELKAQIQKIFDLEI